jgi:hypothetical protein
LDVSKKEAAVISAAIATYLAKSRPKGTSSSLSEIQEILELLLGKISQLEKRVDELDLAVNEIRRKAERTGK